MRGTSIQLTTIEDRGDAAIPAVGDSPAPAGSAELHAGRPADTQAQIDERDRRFVCIEMPVPPVFGVEDPGKRRGVEAWRPSIFRRPD